MTPAAIFEQARLLGVTLKLVEGTIKARGPTDAIQEILPTLRKHKPALLKALSEPSEPKKGEVSDHWLISRPERLESWFSPPVSRAELAERYPGAVLVALPSGTGDPQKDLSAEDAAELTRLIKCVGAAYECCPEEVHEMIEAAARDPGNALSSFRATAKELGLCDAQESPGPSKVGVGGNSEPLGERLMPLPMIAQKQTALPGRRTPSDV